MSDMQPIKPYIIRAYYEWICDNHLTPYLLIQARLPHVVVPEKYIDAEDGTIVLNISPMASNKLLMNNQCIQFQARFDETVWDINIPYYAVAGVYAEENDEGAYFEINPEEIKQTETQKTVAHPAESPKKAARPSHLRVVKNEKV